MRLLFPVLLVGILCVSARASLQDALHAQRELADFTEPSIVRLDLSVSPDTAPRTFYSVVFAFDGGLWIYIPESGSISLGEIAPGAQPAPELITERLRRADDRLRATVVVNSGRVSADAASLNNGCFVGCLANLLALLESGEPIRNAGIVFLTNPPDPGQPPISRLLANQGHAILVYYSGKYWFGLDPNHPADRLDLDAINTDSPVDPNLLRYAGRMNYPTGRVRYLAISHDTLKYLSDDVVWQRRLARKSGLRSK